jgi:PKD repeat protein
MSSDNVGVTQWTWSFKHDGEFVSMEGKVVEYKFRIAGTYNITLQLVDEEGNTAEDSITVTVKDDKEISGSQLVWIALAIAIVVIIVALILFKRK